MSRIIIMILVAAIIPLAFYSLAASLMVGNLKKALMRGGLSEEEFEAIASGKATITRK